MEPFAEGWLNENGEYDGRPMSVTPMKDGSLLVSDDYAGAIYRITYEGSQLIQAKNWQSSGRQGRSCFGDKFLKRFFISIGLILVSLSAFGADLSKGKALSSQCSVCHGKNGIAKDPEAPNLAGLSAFYIEKTLVDYQKGLREDRRMSLIAKTLSMEDVKDLAAWYSAFELTVKEPTL